MMRAMSSRGQVLLFVLGLSSSLWHVANGQTTCRMGKDKSPHNYALWQDEFPNQNDVEALCEGTVNVMDSGEICIYGRVSYRQLAKAIGKPIRAPAADTISLQGHLVTGSANVVLGYEANFLYDFVTTYTINGTEYTAGTDLADRVMAASNGLIDGLCLDKSFSKEPELYAITHTIWKNAKTPVDSLVDANVIYASAYGVVAEYHRPSTSGPWFGTITNSVITFAAGLSPSFIYKWLPLLGAAGVFRYFVVGTVSTSQFPQPLTAPGNTFVENVQIDTEWSTLMSAMSDGLFTTATKIPLYFNVLVKKIEPLTDKSCWSVTAAAIDIQAPAGQGDALDWFVNAEVIPYLTARGNVGLHMGKRLESGSDLLANAWNYYSNNCGVTLNVNPDVCYHPACTRSSITTNFTYSSTYFQSGKPVNKGKGKGSGSYDGSHGGGSGSSY